MEIYEKVRTSLYASYLLALPLEGNSVSPISLLYSASSEGEHIISLTSKSAGLKMNCNLSRAIQGFVYILGSSIFTLSSSTHWSA